MVCDSSCFGVWIHEVCATGQVHLSGEVLLALWRGQEQMYSGCRLMHPRPQSTSVQSGCLCYMSDVQLVSAHSFGIPADVVRLT